MAEGARVGPQIAPWVIGLFMAYKEELVAYRETIYCHKHTDGMTGSTVLYDFVENGKTLYSMFAESGLIKE